MNPRLALASLVVALMMTGAETVHAISLTLVPSSTNVQIGESFSLDLRVENMVSGAAPSLSAFDIDLGFSPSLLTYQSTTFGNGLDILGLGSIQNVTASTGSINLFEVSLDSIADLDNLQPDSFSLAKISFLANGVGSVPFSLSVNSFGDADGNPLIFNLGPLPNVVVSSSTVPEPETFAMLVMGLGLLSLFANHKKLRMSRNQ